MKKSTAIIYLTIFRWDNPFSSSSHSIAEEFAKQGYKVFYISHPFTYKYFFSKEGGKQISRFKSLLKKGKPFEDKEIETPENFHSIIPPLMYPINWLRPGRIYNWMLKKNDNKIRKTIEFLLENYQIEDYIFLNCFDPFYQDVLPKSRAPLANIYQSVDDISQNPYTIRHGLELEKKSAANADLVLTTSSNLNTIMSAYSSNVHTVHNAADISIFSRTLSEKFERPEEIKNINSKIIGFTGCLDAVRINFELLYKIATKHSDKTLLIVGPYDEIETEKSGLKKLSNVIFTDSKKITELPRYLAFMDCVIIPFACNTLTKSIYPLKINEYLASGKPVVSTNFSIDILSFKEHIHLAQNDQEFLDMIDEAILDISSESVEARSTVAKSNSWSSRVNQIKEIVDDFVLQKTKASSGIQNFAVSDSENGLKRYVKSLNDKPALKSFLHWCLIPKNDYKPRWWVSHILSPLIHKRGKGCIIRRKARLDVMPNNKFSLGEGALVEDYAVLNNAVGDLEIGNKSLIGISSTVIGPAKIGNNVLLAQNIVISGLNHGYEDIKFSIREQLTITNEIVIKDDVWIGANSVVVAGVTIGKHSIVAAGSVVTRDVPDYSIAAGSPAKIVKQYNFETETWEKVSTLVSNKI